jgi:hypothetical protein
LNIGQTLDSTVEFNQKSEFAKETTQSNPVNHDGDEIAEKDKNKDENHYQESLAPTNSSTSNDVYYENEGYVADVAANNNNLYQDYPHPQADMTVDYVPSQVNGQDNYADAAANPFQDNSSSGLNSPCSDEQDESRCLSLQSSWDERNLWFSSVDWQSSAESTTPISWNGDLLPIEDLGAFPWSSDSPNSWRALINHDAFENISENMDIHDLLERCLFILFINFLVHSFLVFCPVY